MQQLTSQINIRKQLWVELDNWDNSFIIKNLLLVHDKLIIINPFECDCLKALLKTQIELVFLICWYNISDKHLWGDLKSHHDLFLLDIKNFNVAKVFSKNQ